MAKGTGSTVYLIGLIFSVLVTLSLLGVVYKLSEDLTALEKAIAYENERAAAANEERVRLDQLAKPLRALIHGVRRENEAIDYGHFKTTILDPATKKLNEIVEQEWRATDEWQNLKGGDLAGDFVVDHWNRLKSAEYREADGGPPTYTNLSDLYYDLHYQYVTISHLVPRVRDEKQLTAQQVTDIEREKTTELNRLRQELDDLRRRRNTLQDEKIENEREFDAAKRRLIEEKENIGEVREQLERDFRLVQARLLSEIAKKDSEIEEITAKPLKTYGRFSEQDGEVVHADGGLGWAWINLGRRDGLELHTRFQVYQLDRGGEQRIKGLIEVRSLDEDMAQCAILEGERITHPISKEPLELPDEWDPIVKGDLIRTPIFNPYRTETFVFLGEEPSRAYTRAELEAALESLGADVDRSVTIDTDFVVTLGVSVDAAELRDQVKRASQFGAIFMEEEELLEYTGR